MNENGDSQNNTNFRWVEKFTIISFILSSFTEGVLYIFLSSFLPKTILEKGLNESVGGLIIAAFPISTLIFSIFSKYMIPLMKARNMYLCSYLLSGLILIPFMFSASIVSKPLFCIFCITCRIFQGLGYIGLCLSSMTIIATDYKPIISTLNGVLNVMFGVGAAFGPYFSAIIYTEFGFKGPFIIMAGLIGVSTLSAYFLVHQKNFPEEKSEEEDAFKMKDLFENPELFIPLTANCLTMTYVTFNDYILTVYLMKQFHINIVDAASYLMIGSFTFSIFSPIIGIIVDRTGQALLSYFIGSILIAFGLFFIGPAPFLLIQPNLKLITAMLVVGGLGVSMVIVPTIALAYEILEFNKIELNQSWKNHINIGYIFSRNLGTLSGPFGGGIILTFTSYEWAQTIFSFIQFLLIIISVCYVTARRRKAKQIEQRIYEEISS